MNLVFDRLIALTGVLPPFLMLWYAEVFERRIKERHAAWRYRILVATAIAAIPMAIAEHVASDYLSDAPEPQRTLIDSFVIAAAVEESGKVFCLYLLSRFALAPRTRYGAFLYALHAAAGFAVVENVAVMLWSASFELRTVRFVLRAYMASPMHMFAGGVLGYVWARRRFDDGPLGLMGGLAIAIFIHGTYDALLLAVERLPESYETWMVVCAAAAMSLPLGGVIVLCVLAGKLRAADEVAGR
jgi:RsiW-degrading membrane proteinase PrsW (M82 family)